MGMTKPITQEPIAPTTNNIILGRIESMNRNADNRIMAHMSVREYILVARLSPLLMLNSEIYAPR